MGASPAEREPTQTRINIEIRIDDYLELGIISHEAVSFLGDSLDKVRSFPDGARRELGFQIDRLQRGLDPNEWKPMKTSALASGKSGCGRPLARTG